MLGIINMEIKMHSSKDRAVYMHIPFCNKICSYCDFCKFYYNENWADNYLIALEKEINEKYLNDNIKSIYFGGGSPSSLNTNELKKLFKIIKKFKVNKDAEITFEFNLNEITEEKLKILKDNNVNRLSIGIQSFNEKILKFLNREGSYKIAKEKIDLCKKMGFNNINIDLMYAIPNQSILSLKKDLRLIKKLKVNHVSTYSLIIEDGTILSNENTQPIDEKKDLKMYKPL